MAFYELVKGRHLRDGQVLSAGEGPGEGDILELNEGQAEQFGLHRLRYIGEDLDAVKTEEAKRNKVRVKEEEEEVKEPVKRGRGVK